MTRRACLSPPPLPLSPPLCLPHGRLPPRRAPRMPPPPNSYWKAAAPSWRRRSWSALLHERLVWVTATGKSVSALLGVGSTASAPSPSRVPRLKQGVQAAGCLERAGHGGGGHRARPREPLEHLALRRRARPVAPAFPPGDPRLVKLSSYPVSSRLGSAPASLGEPPCNRTSGPHPQLRGTRTGFSSRNARRLLANCAVRRAVRPVPVSAPGRPPASAWRGVPGAGCPSPRLADEHGGVGLLGVGVVDARAGEGLVRSG